MRSVVPSSAGFARMDSCGLIRLALVLMSARETGGRVSPSLLRGIPL